MANQRGEKVGAGQRLSPKPNSRTRQSWLLRAFSGPPHLLHSLLWVPKLSQTLEADSFLPVGWGISHWVRNRFQLYKAAGHAGVLHTLGSKQANFSARVEFSSFVSTLKSSPSCKIGYTCSERGSFTPWAPYCAQYTNFIHLLLQSASKCSVLLFFNNICLLLEQLVAQALVKCLAKDSIVNHWFLSL